MKSLLQNLLAKSGVSFLLLGFLFQFPIMLRAEDARTFYEGGMKAMNDGDYDLAIQNFEKARDMSPQVAQLHNAVGIAYLQQQKNVEAALEAFQAAIRIDPNLADAHNNLGIIYTGLIPDYELAEEYYREAIRIDPEFTRAYFSLGWLFLTKKKNPEDAVAMLEKTVELQPDYTEAQYYLGLAYIVTDQKPRALKPITILKSLGSVDFAKTLETMMEEDSQVARSRLVGEAQPQETADSRETPVAEGTSSLVQL